MTIKFMNKLARFSVLFLMGIILLAIAIHRPFFGLMDDAANLLLIFPKIREQGLFSYSWEYALNDLSWGMFRPTYPPMIYGLYSIGRAFGSVWMFGVNAIFVFGILFFHAAVIEKIIQSNKWLILLANLAFFYALDLFQFPSLQEKLVLLFGAALLSVAHSARIRLPGKIAGILFFTVLGIFSKASFCIYIAVGTLALADSLRNTPRKPAVLALSLVTFVNIIAIFFLAYVARQGGYTAHSYSLNKVLPNIFSVEGAMFLLPLGVFFALFFRKKFLWEKPAIFIPALGVAAFLAIFLPWGIKAYIQSVISPLYAALLIQLADRIFADKRWIWIPALAGLALIVVLYRSHIMFTRLNDIGRVVSMAPALYAKGLGEIYMPCDEGSLSMENYFKYLEHTDIQVHRLEHREQGAGKILFFDRALCPLPFEFSPMPGCKFEPLYKSAIERGFLLVHQSCESKAPQN